MKKIYPVLLLAVLLFGCNSNTMFCKVEAAMLDEGFFSGNISSDPIISPISDAPPESAEKIFYLQTDSKIDSLQQDIINFNFKYRASSFYENSESNLFKEDSYHDLWETPDGFETLKQALKADRSHMGCGVVFFATTCRWLAQYGSYYVYVRSDISKSGISQDVFMNAVKEIDARIIKCLED